MPLLCTVNYSKNRFLQRTERGFQCANLQSDSDKNEVLNKALYLNSILSNEVKSIVYKKITNNWTKYITGQLKQKGNSTKTEVFSLQITFVKPSLN